MTASLFGIAWQRMVIWSSTITRYCCRSITFSSLIDLVGFIQTGHAKLFTGVAFFFFYQCCAFADRISNTWPGVSSKTCSSWKISKHPLCAVALTSEQKQNA